MVRYANAIGSPDSTTYIYISTLRCRYQQLSSLQASRVQLARRQQQLRGLCCDFIVLSVVFVFVAADTRGHDPRKRDFRS